MLCVYQSFTSFSGEDPEILLQLQLEGRLCTAEDVNMKQLAFGEPLQATQGACYDIYKVTELQKGDRRDLKMLHVLLPSLVQGQLDCSHSRIWFNSACGRDRYHPQETCPTASFPRMRTMFF